MSRDAGAAPRPAALDHLDAIRARMAGRATAVFLDYDGTLTPIVDRPEAAVLDETMRASVRRLAAAHRVAIVSGRSLADVRSLVAIDGLHYAGNHGLEIAGPDGARLLERGAELLPELAECRQRLESALAGVPGVVVEDKRQSLSVHYRLAPAGRVDEIAAAVEAVLTDHPRLRKHLGKKIFEVRPRLDWDKGRAVLWLLDEARLSGLDPFAIYVGDDVTDEDAFRVLRGRGIGVRVGSRPAPTEAAYRLRDPGEVRLFLEALAA